MSGEREFLPEDGQVESIAQANSDSQTESDVATDSTSGQVTLTSPDHYQTLVGGLWNFFKNSHGTDLTYLGGRAHWLIAELFLSPGKLAQTCHDSNNSKQELSQILEFLYKGTVTVAGDELSHLLETAKKLKFTLLETALVAAGAKDMPASGDKVESDRSAGALQPSRRQKAVSTVRRPQVANSKMVIRKTTEARTSRIRQAASVPQRPKEELDVAIEGIVDAMDSTADGGIILDLSQFGKNERLFVDVDGLAEPIEIVLQSVDLSEELADANEDPQPAEVKAEEEMTEAKEHQQTVDVETEVEAEQGEPHQYVCHLCPKTFAKRAYLTLHIRTHEDIKNLVCDICGKKYVHRQSLNNHRITHFPRQHVCHICDKGFIQLTHLTDHLAIHSGNKPHICHVCSKTFYRTTQLNRHMVQHTGERRHQCEVCHKRFSNPQGLKLHQRTHTGEKPYTCDFCQKSFTLRHHLTAHERGVHGHKR